MHDKLLKGGGARVADVVLVQLREGVQKILLLSVRATCREHLQRREALRLASQAVRGQGGSLFMQRSRSTQSCGMQR